MSNSALREAEYLALRQFLKTAGTGENRIAAAVREELTARQREMVELYYLRQMRMTDIAQLLGVSVSTVSRTLDRGRTRLRRALRYGDRRLLSRED